MKRIYFILIILFSFGQAEAQDKVDFLRTKVDGNRNIVDARLRLSHSLNIPRGASWSLNGAKDSIGYVMFNTTLQRFGVYHGSGVWKAYATIDEIELLLDGKVDTIHGKGLSTEDYTTAEKSKLAGIAAGAEVNVNADWLAVSGDAQILNKPTFVATESDPVFLAQKGVANGVASLNSSGKIPNAQIPALALVDTYVTASQAAMLALSTAEQGDVAIRTDVSKTFILTDNNYSTLASWSELLSPIIPAETDPIWGASPSAGITGTDISNWNTAYGWGNPSGVYLPFSGGTLTGALIGTTIKVWDGTHGLIMGAYPVGGYGGIWPSTVTPNTANYSFVTNAGITYLAAGGADGLSVNSSGETVMYGNVGIGTSTISSSGAGYKALNINGTTGAEIYLKSNGSNLGYMYANGGAFVIDAIGSTPLVLRTGSANRLSISSAGVVNIDNLSGTGTRMMVVDNLGNVSTQTIPSGGGGGTVSTVGVISANGFAGTSSGGANPDITISTTITGILQGNGTSISATTSGATLTDVLHTTGSETKSGVLTLNNALTLKASSAGEDVSVLKIKDNSGADVWSIKYSDSDGELEFSGYNLKVTNSITAASFIGSGSGLTGTASSLTAGAANSVAWTNVSGRPTALSSFTNDAGYITSASGVLAKGNLLISGDGTTTTFNTGLTGGTVMVVSPSSTAAIGLDYYLTQISNVWYILFPTPPANGTTVRFYAIVS